MNDVTTKQFLHAVLLSHMALFVVLFLLALTPGTSDDVPPESLNHIAHITFPRDRLAAQILRTQREKFGLPRGLRCSSLLGPTCVSSEALIANDKVISEDSLHSGDGIRIERLTLGGQTNEKGMTSSTPLDAIMIAELGLGPALPEEELEDARNNLGAFDPLVLARAADKIAELAQIQDRDRFRHKFLSAFASSLVDHGSPAEALEDGEEEDIYEDVDDFFMPPAKVDQEESLEARREAARVDRITRRVKDTMAEVLPVHRYIEDEENEEEAADITHAERT